MFTFDDDTYPDLYKDAYGIRPGIDNYLWWKSAGDQEKQEHWDYLVAVMQEREAEDRLAEQAAIEHFEELVTRIMAAGRTDRATVLRWLMDAGNYQGDWDYMCYGHGLPYGYFNDVPNKQLPQPSIK